MSARPCRWCGASLRACLIKHLNSGRPCCRGACDHGLSDPETDFAKSFLTNERNQP